MPGLIALVIFVVFIGPVLLYVGDHWQAFLAGVFAIGALWFAIVQSKKARIAARVRKAEQERQRQEEIARDDAHKAQQQTYQSELVNIGSTSLNLFEAMPTHLLDAESLLDQAERDFNEGAFAPFWDSIERATMRLGRFDSSVASISHHSKRHGELAKVYEAMPPRFPIVIDSIRGMTAANTTSGRMRAIVRTAQCNFQFASIYEQRKTNHLLVAGFTNLAQALDGMGARIAESIDGLSTQVSEMSSTLNSSLTSLGQQLEEGNQATHNLTETVKGLHGTVQKEASEQAERHDRALVMLDNIQRRRRPIGSDPLKNLGTERY